jgi:hypothetical protein
MEPMVWLSSRKSEHGVVRGHCLKDQTVFRLPVRENPSQQLFSTETGEKNQGFPSPISVSSKWGYPPTILV